MIATPDLSHLTRTDYDSVYEPAEDTFLLLDALEQEADQLRALNPRICLEIGSGSGCVSCFLSKILGKSAAVYLCTDINPHATRCTSSTAVQNKVVLDSILASLCTPLITRLHHSVDVLLFNPPYVPTISGEASSAQETADIQSSWAGGMDGMHITNHLLPLVEDLLSPQGRFYLVALKQNNVPDIRRKMLEAYRLNSEVVIQRRAGREYLYVVRFMR